MDPEHHLIVTTVICVPLILVGFFDLIHLAIALASTIAFDAIDHTLALFFISNPLMKEVRRLVREQRFLVAYKAYKRRRKREMDYLHLHNLIFLLITIPSTIFSLFNPLLTASLAVGVMLHLLCDLVYSIAMGEQRFWLKGWRYLIRKGY
jgi:hypothetical protein